MLREYWRGVEFFVSSVGGDFSLPGAEQQGMHVDARGVDELKVYFTTVDFDQQTGPPRYVRGSHHWRGDPREVDSVLGFCPARPAIIMNMEVWHGGTANKSSSARPMLSVHYSPRCRIWTR